MNQAIVDSIAVTMLHLGYDYQWAMAWTALWKVYFLDSEMTLVIDLLKD